MVCNALRLFVICGWLFLYKNSTLVRWWWFMATVKRDYVRYQVPDILKLHHNSARNIEKCTQIVQINDFSRKILWEWISQNRPQFLPSSP